MKDKFRLHQAINSTFIRFLTRHMADQTLAGLKGMVEGFEKKIMDLTTKVASLTTTCTNKVSQDIFNRLDTKVNKIVDVNNLKKSAGGGGLRLPVPFLRAASTMIAEETSLTMLSGKKPSGWRG